MNYYNQQQLLAPVDKDDRVLGKVDKWQAHREGILHRGFTVGLFYQNQILLQHRKHPVFDGCLDLACSSHPVFQNGRLQNLTNAAYEALTREWRIKKTDLAAPIRNRGFVYYRVKDTASGFVEHEVCHLLTTEIKTLPAPDFDYAYGFSLMDKNRLSTNSEDRRKLPLAPWVTKLVKLL